MGFIERLGYGIDRIIRSLGAFHFLGEFSPQRRREHREKHKNLCGLCVSAVNLHILPKN